MNPSSSPRVVSLVPSVTESLRAWGVDPIACTRFCEQPDLPTVGGTKNPDIGAIVELAPDLVVVEREENRLEDHDALLSSGLDVEALHVTSLENVGPELERLALRVGVRWRLELPHRAPVPAVVTSAFVPIWRRPYMTINAATYGSSVLAWLGVRNVFADSAVTYPEVEETDIAAAGPDVILVPSEPYEFTDAQVVELGRHAPTLRIDGQDLFWWGTRTPAALQRLGAALAQR